MLEFYNEITSEAGSEIIVNGWKATGIYDAIEMGSSALPSIDPFQDISPLPIADADDDGSGNSLANLSSGLKEDFVNVVEDDDDDFSYWGRVWRGW